MPKSKRNQKVSLTATSKKTFFELKEKLVNKIRDSCDEFERIFIFSVKDMRNSKLKDVRQEWKDSRWFEEFSDEDYARSGNIANETVVLDAGPLKEFPHSMEPRLRSLGMPTSLQKGVVTLLRDFEVCTEGAPLTPEQASILKLLDNKMAQFKMTIEAVWESDGYFEEYVPLAKSEREATTRIVKTRKGKKNKFVKKEQMSEDENDDEEMSEEDEEEDDE